MTLKSTKPAAGALAFFALLLPLSRAQAQSAAAIPRLDMNQFIAPWYEIARYPVKKEKSCLSDGLVLFALNDKKNTFQRVTSCKIKGDNTTSWNANGKLAADGSGRLKIRTLLFLSSSYWVLAAAPSYDWIVVGTPNRKSLWILSKTPSLPADTFSAAQSRAASAGFDTSKLLKIDQQQQKIADQPRTQNP